VLYLAAKCVNGTRLVIDNTMSVTSGTASTWRRAIAGEHAMKHPDEYDFLDPKLQRCPFEFYKALRREAPVYREPQTGFYLVSCYDDVMEVKKNLRVFSSKVMKAVTTMPPPEALAIYRQGRKRPQTLQRSDPPQHTRYRKLIGKTFTIARVQLMAPYIKGIVNELLDKIPPDGVLDWATQYAIPLPCIVIADQLGVPREDALKLKIWSDGLLDPAGRMVSREREIECARLTLEFQEYFAAKIEQRRRSPQDDILTDLSSRIDGEDPFTVEEVLNMIEQIMTGGNESTTGLLGSVMLTLIRYPQQERLLRENPAQIPNFIEEVLRTESPVQSNFRVAVEDAEIGGVKIPKGSVVVLRYGAANRDEEKFTDSETFDACRRNVREHIAFGAGIHHCPGSMLARQETLQTITEVLNRFERFELLMDADELEYNPTFFLRGLKKLPVRFVRKAS
jgi:cytochrome P450